MKKMKLYVGISRSFDRSIISDQKGFVWLTRPLAPKLADKLSAHANSKTIHTHILFFCPNPKVNDDGFPIHSSRRYPISGSLLCAPMTGPNNHAPPSTCHHRPRPRPALSRLRRVWSARLIQSRGLHFRERSRIAWPACSIRVGQKSLMGAAMARHSARVVVRPSLVSGHADRSLCAPGDFSDQHLFVGGSVGPDQKEPVLWTDLLARIRKVTWSLIYVRTHALTIAPRRARMLPQIPRRHHR